MNKYNQPIVIRIYYKMNLPKHKNIFTFGKWQISICGWHNDKHPVPIFAFIPSYKTKLNSIWINGRIYNQYKRINQ